MSLEHQQQELGLRETGAVKRVEEYKFEPIRGYPMLHWAGKRPFSSTQYYPAQHKETYGPEVEDWRNKIYWGDNLQVMSHLLKEYREQIQLIYIDPPFDAKADYKRNISARGKTAQNDLSTFEEKQYSDIWSNDEYLQFMYERLILIRELLSDEGSLYLHCDWHKSHYLRLMLEEIFGGQNFRNELVWHYKTFQGQTQSYFARKHDTIFLYTKTDKFVYHQQYDTAFDDTIDSKRWATYINDKGQIMGGHMPTQDSRFVRYLDKWIKNHHREPKADDVIYEVLGQPVDSVWDLKGLDPKSQEKVDYPTQKPRMLLERIIKASSDKGGIILAESILFPSFTEANMRYSLHS